MEELIQFINEHLWRVALWFIVAVLFFGWFLHTGDIADELKKIKKVLEDLKNNKQ